MSVCFFVPADQAGASTTTKVEPEESEDTTANHFGPATLQQFWVKVMDDMKKVTAEDFKTQALPLARIKKIMKLDEDVKMISGEAPVLFAKAAEIFIHELTMRAWAHTEDNKRRTLQRNDIAMALAKSDQFDFLIDIVPRHEAKVSKPREDPLRTTATPEQQTNHQPQQQANVQTQTTPQPMVLQPCTQVVQNPGASPAPGVVTPQPVALVQQLVTPTGELQQVPIQLTQSQLSMIRLHVQNNPNQPFIIQAQPQSPQIIQVSSQAQHATPQPVFLAQVAPSPDDS